MNTYFVKAVRKITIMGCVNGRTEPLQGVYEVGVGEKFSILAIPDSGYWFDHFDVNGVWVDKNPVEI